MVSMEDVRRWSPEGLEEAYRGLRKQEEALVEAGDGFGADAKVADWTGRAADAAESTRTALLDRMRPSLRVLPAPDVASPTRLTP